jgi:hypothetical protein
MKIFDWDKFALSLYDRRERNGNQRLPRICRSVCFSPRRNLLGMPGKKLFWFYPEYCPASGSTARILRKWGTADSVYIVQNAGSPIAPLEKRRRVLGSRFRVLC